MARAPKGRSQHIRISAALKPVLSNISPEKPDYIQKFYGALHYGQYDLSEKQYKKEALEYAKRNKLDVKLLSVLPDQAFNSLGKYFYLLNGGVVLPEGHAKGMPAAIDRLFERAKVALVKKKAEDKKAEVKATAPHRSIQDYMRDQAAAVASEFDGWLDSLVEDLRINPAQFSPADKMTIAGIKSGQASWLVKFYEPELEELKAVLAGKDEDLKEGYSNLKRLQVQRMVELLEKIVSAAKLVKDVSKANRKPRKKKALNVEKMVSRIKYKEKDTDLGVASQSPVNILGAQEVWVYNTKKRKLGQYVAADGSGLSCKGASIVGYSEDASSQKTLRKPKDQIKTFMGVGKVQLRKFLGSIKGVDTKLGGRMSDDVLILRIIK